MDRLTTIVILGGDLTSPVQIQQIAGLKSPPDVIPCEALNEDDEDDGTTLGCCHIDDDTKTALKIWEKAGNKSIKMFTFIQSKAADITQGPRSYPVPYFFYGRLSDSELWVGRLGFEEAPAFVDAEIRGYEIKMWGDYKALVTPEEPGLEDNVVKGKMYMVRNEEVLEKIAAYETNNYGVRLCNIFYGDGGGSSIQGCVFEFRGDLSRLRTMDEYEVEQRTYQELDALSERVGGV